MSVPACLLKPVNTERFSKNKFDRLLSLFLVFVGPIFHATPEVVIVVVVKVITEVIKNSVYFQTKWGKGKIFKN